MKKKNKLQMLAALLAATLSMALTSPIAAKANEEYNVDTTKETNADTGRIYYLKNSHGDVIGQMDENGTVLTSYAYNAFGEQVSAVATKGEQKSTANRFLYAGEQYDETSSLYYLRARHYDVSAGRFTQEDTYLGDGRNLYAYVHSNPLKYVDPTGHNAEATPDDDTNLLDDKKVYEGSKASENTGVNIASSKSVPNPYGKLGSPAHRETVNAIVENSQGKVTTEVKYSTPGGDKSYRYADAVEEVNGNVTNIYQVGKVNQNGTPVAREMKAINDIMASPAYNGAPITFVPYNSSVEPIIFQ